VASTRCSAAGEADNHGAAVAHGLMWPHAAPPAAGNRDWAQVAAPLEAGTPRAGGSHHGAPPNDSWPGSLQPKAGRVLLILARNINIF